MMSAFKAQRACASCGQLTDSNAGCSRCVRKQKQRFDSLRGSASERGYGAKWQRESRLFLRANPLCQCDECQGGAVRIRPAEVVDHEEPHRLAQAKETGSQALIAAAYRLFWDRKNWRAMSKRCHDKKTGRGG